MFSWVLLDDDAAADDDDSRAPFWRLNGEKAQALPRHRRVIPNDRMDSSFILGNNRTV